MIRYPHTKNKEILIIRIIYPHTTLKQVKVTDKATHWPLKLKMMIKVTKKKIMYELMCTNLNYFKLPF